MTAIEIKEQELIREKAKEKAPCQYTIDELKARLKQGRVSAKEGIYKTQSEMKRKHVI